MKLFEALKTYNRLEEYIPFFDWIFEEKFPEETWDNKNKIQAYAKKIKKLDGVSDSNFTYDAQKRIVFPVKNSYKQFDGLRIYMSDGDSMARDWLRHIRNGIAHGLTQVIQKNGNLFIELLDFSDKSQKNQTAYFLIPIDFLLESKKIYDEKTKSFSKKKQGKMSKI